MMDRDRLKQVRQQVETSTDGLPPNLCSDVADLLGMTDVTFALIGGPSRRLTLCASSAAARALDQWQFTLDEGPCLDAAATGQAAASPTNDRSPWPQLAEKAAELGYEAIGGVPLAVSGRPYGAMNIQSAAALAEHALEEAREVSNVLSQPIMNRLAEHAPRLVDLADYTVVHQAAGMISAQMGITIDDALAVLRARAWTEGRLLVEVANQVVDREVRFDPPSQ